MYDGYFSLGSNEIVNNARAFAYSNALMPAAGIMEKPGNVPGIPLLLEQTPYTTPEADRAPWYDEDVPESTRFAGFFATRVTGLDDSTYSAEVVEGLKDGGFTLEGRNATREIRIRGFLLGVDELAVNAGLTWLRSALNGQVCGVHDAICRQMDLTFFAARPDLDGTEPDLDAERLRYMRYLHDVSLTVAPIVRSRRDIAGCGHVAEVEFAVTANDPPILTFPFVAGLSAASSVVTINEPATEILNLAPHPSFSEWSELQTVWTNLISNPSGESGTTNWAAYIQGNTAAGTVTNPVVADAPFGRRMIRVTWTAANANARDACGIRVNASVTAGQQYVFRMAGIRSSIRQRLQFSIEWRNASGFISGTNPPDSTFIAEPGRIYNKTHPPVTAPANATSVWLRVHSAFGTGQTSWRVGSYLEVDGAMMVAGNIIPAYFDGSFKATDAWVYDWASGSHSSSSRQRARQPLGALPASQTFPNALGWMGLSQTLGRWGKNSIRYQWLTTQTAGAEGDIGMGGGLEELAAVTPGQVYNGSIYVKMNRQFRARTILVWYDGSGSVISTSAGPYANYSSETYHRFSHSATAPALAVRVAVRVRLSTSTSGTGPTARFAAGTIAIVDAAQVTLGAGLLNYFDGSFQSNTTFRYSWVGLPGQSVSVRNRVLPADSIGDIILDPLLPVIPPPPRPPLIPDFAFPAVTAWRRQARLIEAEATTIWATAFPIIRLRTAVARRRIRVTFIPNPYGEEDGSYTDVAELESTMVVSYLPANSTITIDCTLRRAWVQQADGTPVPANSLLYSNEGGPVVWPTLRSGQEHILSIDIPSTATGALPSVESLLITRKE